MRLYAPAKLTDVPSDVIWYGTYERGAVGEMLRARPSGLPRERSWTVATVALVERHCAVPPVTLVLVVSIGKRHWPAFSESPLGHSPLRKVPLPRCEHANTLTGAPAVKFVQVFVGYCWPRLGTPFGTKSESTIGSTKPSAPSMLQTSSPARFALPVEPPRQGRRIGSLSCIWVGSTSQVALPDAPGTPLTGVSPHTPVGGLRCTPSPLKGAAVGTRIPPGPVNCRFGPFAQLAFPVDESQLSALQYGLAPKPWLPELEVLGERPRMVANTSEVPDVSSRRNACQGCPLIGAAAQAALPFEQPFSKSCFQLLTRVALPAWLQSTLPPGERSAPP